MDLPLANPTFREPSRIDLLLGVEVFAEVLRYGPAGSPVALVTDFGWVLSGGADVSESIQQTLRK